MQLAACAALLRRPIVNGCLLLLFVIAVAILSSLAHVSVVALVFLSSLSNVIIMKIARTIFAASSCSKSGKKGKMMKV